MRQVEIRTEQKRVYFTLSIISVVPPKNWLYTFSGCGHTCACDGNGRSFFGDCTKTINGCAQFYGCEPVTFVDIPLTTAWVNCPDHMTQICQFSYFPIIELTLRTCMYVCMYVFGLHACFRFFLRHSGGPGSLVSVWLSLGHMYSILHSTRHLKLRNTPSQTFSRICSGDDAMDCQNLSKAQSHLRL